MPIEIGLSSGSSPAKQGRTRADMNLGLGLSVLARVIDLYRFELLITL